MEKKKKHREVWIKVVVSLFVIVSISGCVSRKKTIFFQDVGKDNVVNIVPQREYLIQCGDILYIKVQSMDERASAFISGTIEENNTNSFGNSEQYLYFNGYEVSQNGKIRLPYLDSLKVVGMSTDQIASLLTDSLTPFLKEALITVKLASFRVCIFGEVQNPGSFLFFRKEPNILDLIALAKPTEYYNAKNVIISRQVANDRIKIERIDLTSSKILTSPYYHLHPNDQIYIEPLKVKKYGFATFPYALLLSTISTVLIVISIFRK